MPYALVGTVDGRRVNLGLREGDQVVGRDPGSDLRLDHRSVSRRHALVSVTGDAVTVTDLGSRNGTRVDGERAVGPTPARVGSRIALGGVVLTLRVPGAGDSTEYGLSRSAVVTAAVPSGDVRASSDGSRGGSDLFRVLADAGQFLVSERSLAGVYEDVLGLVERTVRCDRVVVLSAEGEERTPTVKASRVTHERGRADELVLSTTMVRQVLDEGVSLLTADAQEDPRFRTHESVVRQGIRAAMAAPLFDNQRVIGLLYADTTEATSRYGPDELRAFTVLANLVAVKITQARLAEVEEEKRRLERELGTAREILGHILPERVEGADDYEVCVSYVPCAEVGGDLYDVKHLDGGRSLVMAGDAAGKGLGAAILVSSIVPAAEVLLQTGQGLVDAVRTLNRQVCATTDAVRYATLFVGLLDRASGRLEYVNAGHNAPLLIDAGGGVAALEATGMPVGMLEEAPFETADARLEPGSLLAVFSDGITEAVGRGEEFYGEERLTRALLDARSLSAQAVSESAMRDLASFTSGTPQSDDIVLVVVRRTQLPRS
jgi:serine phosphatase RsbU (regulator of sigma subunit)